jgi:hypothetical protein
MAQEDDDPVDAKLRLSTIRKLSSLCAALAAHLLDRFLLVCTRAKASAVMDQQRPHKVSLALCLPPAPPLLAMIHRYPCLNRGNASLLRTTATSNFSNRLTDISSPTRSCSSPYRSSTLTCS